MTRNQEYQELLIELESTPTALEYSVQRAKAKAKRTLNIRNLFLLPVSSMVALFMIFVIMVNLSMSFALAFEGIPLLSELAAAVSFSPTLRKVVENEYVQPVGLEQTENGVTMRIDYVMVSPKRLNVLFTLESQEYSPLHVNSSVFDINSGELINAGFSGNHISMNNGVSQFTNIAVDFSETTPESLIFECEIYESYDISGAEPITTFSFPLIFDPEYIHQGEMIELNQDIVLDGQHITVTTVEIYTTHISVNISGDASNMKKLMSISLYLADENGKQYEEISYGSSGIGSRTGYDSPWQTVRYLESAFFDQNESLTLFITDTYWWSNWDFVEVDLVNAVADNLPEEVNLEQCVRKGDMWELTFSAAVYGENTTYLSGSGTNGMIGSNNEKWDFNWSRGIDGYYDETLGKYVEMPERFLFQCTFSDYPHDTVIIGPHLEYRIMLETPIEIKVK